MIFTFQRSVEGDWELYEEFCKNHPNFPLLFFMRKQISDELKEAGVGFSIEKIRECNLHDPALHSFEFVIDVQSITHNGVVSCNFSHEDEQTLIALLQSHAYDLHGMAGFFHIGDYSFEENRRIDTSNMIAQMLDLSTGHCPNQNPDFGDARWVEHECGWVVWVSQAGFEGGPDVDIPAWLYPIMGKALELENCVLIHFHQDADISPEFKVYDW